MPVLNYLGLVLYSVALLAAFVLAFGALTVIWRRHWETFGPAESLLARLAAAALLAMLASAGAQYLVVATLNALVQQGQFGLIEAPVNTADARNRALAVILAALALSVIAVLRIERYHRRVTGISRRESDEEWQSEEPEEPRAPRERF